MANLLLLKTDMTKLPKHGTGGQTMKFKKDGKVYESFEDAVDAFFLGDRKIFVNGEKAELKFRLLLLLHHVLRIQGSAGPLGDIPRGSDIHAGRVPFRERRRVGRQNGFF